ncbi:MAG: hypothetical protein M1834_008813 [Cirrosporium novae-zelandiae]|nr:MAG: hypothetical protein M1834_008813 [Cirrosporium novae-zelandiae]
MSTPTLINLPPPPSNPETPSEMGPGTPNSTTTSLSTLSTTAIKDGHRGQSHPHGHTHHHSGSGLSSLDAERADRISRLAGLERVTAARSGSSGLATYTSGTSNQPPSYFDTTGGLPKERSTVGSASATEPSVGARTTWASSSDAYEGDKMSEDPDDGMSSLGGFSDEGNASLVAFGEGASGISGPISTPHQRALAARHFGSIDSPSFGRATPEGAKREPRMIDGMTYDAGVTDTTARPPLPATPSTPGRTTPPLGNDDGKEGVKGNPSEDK